MIHTYTITSECAQDLKPFTKDLHPNYFQTGAINRLPQKLHNKYKLPSNIYEIGAILHAINNNQETANLHI